MTQISAYIGLDVHKNSISIAAAESGSREKASFHGRIPNDLTRLLKRLAPFGPAGRVKIAYEAGPTGYGLARRLRSEGYDCVVIAPAKTPRASSDRVKTDRRDAMKLATFLRSGHLTEVRVPTPEEEALRDLLRAREDVKSSEVRTRRRLNSMMLRHGRIWRGSKCNWTKGHYQWLEEQQFEHRASNEAKVAYLEQIRQLQARLAELDSAIEDAVLASPQKETVLALRAMKGISTLTAATLIAEIGDFSRFEAATRFMSFLGLTPSESSSGDGSTRGPITKAGNGRLRRLLVESAWTYTRAPHLSVPLKKRQIGVSEAVLDISWKAQKRLYRQRQRLIRAGKSHRKIIVAMARELAGFVWAVAKTPDPQAAAS